MTNAVDRPVDTDSPSVWIGVVGHGLQLRRRALWWCLPAEAQSGDRILMYQTRLGVCQVEAVVGVRTVKESHCTAIGLQTFDTHLLTLLNSPITAAEFRAHATLKTIRAVRRNFQGTCFDVPPQLVDELDELLLRHGAPRP